MPTRVVSLEMSNYVMKMLESVSEVLDATLEVIPLAITGRCVHETISLFHPPIWISP